MCFVLRRLCTVVTHVHGVKEVVHSSDACALC